MYFPGQSEPTHVSLNKSEPPDLEPRVQLLRKTYTRKGRGTFAPFHNRNPLQFLERIEVNTRKF